MKKTALSLCVLAMLAWAATNRAAGAHWTSPYYIVWTNQSADARGSMPCGAGNLGLIFPHFLIGFRGR
jgi:hypothetical protein